MSKAAKRERQRLNRETRRQAEMAQAKRRRTLKTVRNVALILLPLAALFVVLQVTRDDDEAAAIECTNEKPETPADTSKTYPAPPAQTIESNVAYTAVLETSCGKIEILLDQATAPQTVNNFVFLAREGYYNGTVFYRVAKDFVVQGGDPAGGTGPGPGYVIPDEFPQNEPAGLSYPVGAVAMANAGPGTSAADFFIITGRGGEGLTPDYSRFGNVIKGQKVAKKLESFSNPNENPADPTTQVPTRELYLFSVTIKEEPLPDVTTTTAATTAPPAS